MANHHELTNFIWQIADLLRGPYRPPQYERVMLPMTVLRRFDCVLAPTKAKVLAEHERRKGGRLNDDAIDKMLNKASGQRFHNHSPLTFEKLKGDPDNIEKHLVSYTKGFSANVRTIFDFFEFESEIEKMREANILYLVVSKFCDVNLHPDSVPNEEMGLIFENLTPKDPTASPVSISNHQSAIDNPFEPDPDLRDFENVPLKDDIDTYFEREVRPHVLDAWMDRSKDKVGYEINFNRHFYKYIPPRPLEEIDAELKEVEEEIMRLLREVAS
jgi:hypothetical protein